MYFLNGFAANIETLAYLAANKSTSLDSFAKLRGAYKDFLKDLQDQTYQMPGENVLCYDNRQVQPVMDMFTDKSLLTDLTTDVAPTPSSASREALAVVEQALAILQVACPELSELFRLTIHTIFYARSTHSGGGSVSTAIGVIWCSHRRDWSLLDVLEFLIHELTHSLIFLDELRFQYFYSNDAIALPRNFARSAILKKNRPLDKSFHSAVVAYEILQLRQRLGYEPKNPKAHPDSQTLQHQTLACIESMLSLENLDELATPRVAGILEQMRKNLSARDEGRPACIHG